MEFVGPINSTFMHCLQKTGQQLWLKKKKRENTDAARLSAIQTYTKTNYATKGKSDESSKIEQIGMDQTSNVEDEETNDDNIPFNKLYNHRHTVITKH